MKRPESGLVYATRRFTFSAAHRYGRPEWSPEENRKVFGSLTRVHGHNYALEITIRGPVDEQTGMLMDLGELKRVVGEVVTQRFDHSDLNEDPLFSGGAIPTTENLARGIWDLLAPKLGADRLWRVRLWEDPTFYVDYYGP
ncbi:MAG: 6-carboxytetrahydropterin synthase [Candidatus Rokubacteria bacterium]|nr:6-carboxytetrahydropterin synthase [Candidatus Rokubacteria bacterium]